MKNLNLVFPFLKLCITNTSEILKNLFNLTHELQAKNLVVNKHQLSKGLPEIDLLTLFPELNDQIHHYSYLGGTSYVTDIILLKQLAKKYNVKNYFEFGTWRGESIINVADIAENCVSLSFSKDDMRKVGMNDSAIKASRIFSKEKTNIQHIKHNTQTFDFSNHEKKYDLIFVDADHMYEGVKIDTSNAFKLLKNEQSIIVWHDYGRTTEDINWQVFAGILDGTPSEKRKNLYRVSNTLCAIYISEKFLSGFPEKHLPNKTFNLTLKADKLN